MSIDTKGLKGFLQHLKWSELIVVFLFAVSIVSGILMVDDYGLSWDEYRDVSYGKLVLKAYDGSEDFLRNSTNRYYYGPFYWMLVNLISEFVGYFPIDIQVIHIWKVVDFLIFQIGVLAFYYLCRRYISRIPAIFTMAMLMTQPLLWGHAFINHKDIPLMTFFLLSILFGLRGIDIFTLSLQKEGDFQRKDYWHRIRDRWRTLRLEWYTAKGRSKFILLLILSVVVVFSIELIFTQRLFLPAIQSVVRNAYAGNSITPINDLFDRMAQGADQTPVDAYLDTITRIYTVASWIFIIAMVLIARFVYRRIFHPVSKEKGSAYRFLFPLIAGITLGLTISIRVVGMYAGVLVSGYLIYRSTQKAVVPLIVYWIVAACVTYATWPYLWGAPIPRLLESIQEAGSFSSLETLFQGVIQASENMPIHYLPYLLMVQLTEPALLLILLGIIILIGKWRRKEVERAYLLLIGAWFAVPMLAEIVLRVPIYDNFRQFLFIVPPFILISGWGAAYLYERLKPNWVAVTILVIMLLPGIVGIVRLHPYEYVYYNAIVGGVNGAYGKYELDYWCTSLKEAMGFLNENAKPNSTVYISGPIDAATPYARDDLKFVHNRSLVPDPDYVVACRNVVLSEEFYPDYEVIHEVGIGRGVFAIVKEKTR